MWVAAGATNDKGSAGGPNKNAAASHVRACRVNATMYCRPLGCWVVVLISVLRRRTTITLGHDINLPPALAVKVTPLIMDDHPSATPQVKRASRKFLK